MVSSSPPPTAPRMDAAAAAAAAAATPVGVRIAYQKSHPPPEAADADNDENANAEPSSQTMMMIRRSSHASLKELAASRRKRRTHRRRRRRRYSSQEMGRRRAGKITKPISSWTVFWEGALLYTACLVLPALVGTLWRLWRDRGAIVDAVLAPVCGGEAGDPSSSSMSAASLLSVWIGWLGAVLLRPLCQWYDPEAATAFFTNHENNNISNTNNNTTHNDVWTVALCSMALAVLRLLIVQWTVMPLQSSDQLEAMIRCKSVHLLSSDYSQTPTIGTPVLTHRPTLPVDTSGAPPLPWLFPQQQQHHIVPPEHHDDDDHALGLGIDDTEREEVDPILSFGSRLEQKLQQIPTQINVPDENDNDDDEEDDDDAVDATLMEELADRLAAAAKPDRSIYAGPRYATAMFRLLYSTAAVTLALYYFSDADFWPWYLGGTGSTANCWDLSGGLTVSGLDADFDQRNQVLKQYFLWQASYHWHSGAFHILSMILLLLHPPPADTDTTTESSAEETHPHGRVWALRTNSSAYVRSLSHHIIGLGSIAVAYVFSSLRRLTAIGLFAFDVSSWFLHLLQVCINAPPDSPLARIPAAALHQYVVVPVFLLARLGVWPALAWSAMTDSQRWLEQLERTLWPGSARQLRMLLFVQMTLVLASTAVYGKRLWYHDHVRRAGAKQE